MNNIISIDSLNREQGLNVSEQYKVIKTGDLVSQFVEEGYQVTSLVQAKTRKTELTGFTKHMIRLRNPNLNIGIDGLFPEIVIKNSYNGTSAFEIMMGVFRLVCSNGLIVGNTYESLKVRHVGEVMPKVLTAISAIQTQTDRIESEIKLMNERTLSQAEIAHFAQQVAEQLVPETALDENGQVLQTSTNVRVMDLVRVKRSDDTKSDLWTVMNRVQENALRGGLRYQTLKSDGDIRNSTARRINSIDRSIEMNRLVWDVATEILAA